MNRQARSVASVKKVRQQGTSQTLAGTSEMGIISTICISAKLALSRSRSAHNLSVWAV